MPFHGNTVIADSALTAGIRSTFSTAYAKSAGASPLLPNCMDLGLPSDKLTELYAYPESAPHPQRWDRGKRVPMKAFEYVNFQVTNYDYAIAVPWHLNDEEDDLTRSLPRQAQGAGRNFGTLRERILFELITATNSLLPAIPNAPDSLAAYSTSARFGLSGGNVVTGTGTTAAAIIADVFSVIESFMLMQDTEGQPLWDEGMLQNFTIVFPADMMEAMTAAFFNPLTLSTVTNVAGTENVAAAAPTNTIRTSGRNFGLWGTPRLTGVDYYVFMDDCPYKPFFHQARRGLTYSEYTRANSDNARLTKEVAVQWDCRDGFGVFLPYGTMKVDNT